MWSTTLAYLVGLGVTQGGGFYLWSNGGLSLLATALPGVLCWIAVRGAGVRRTEVLLLAIGMTGFAVGNAIFVRGAVGDVPLTFPSLADVGYLCLGLFALLALAVAAARDLGRRTAGVWLDGVMVALGTGSVMAIILGPSLVRSRQGWLVDVVALAHPALDLLMVSLVVAMVAVRGGRPSTNWWLALASVLVFGAADIVYAAQVARDTYLLGTPLDSLWVVGLALLASWACRRPRVQDRAPARSLVPSAVSVVATVVALVVLVLTLVHRVPVPASVLAVLTLVGAVARSQVAVRQLRSMPELRAQALTDDLTGLPNRRAFYADVDSELAGSPRPRALLLMDLDRFKDVNDGLGHHAGDQLLVLAGQRLRTLLGPTDLLARLGGDEFAVLLDQAHGDRPTTTALAMCAALAEPFAVEGHSVRSSASIGIALAPEHGSDVSTLLRRADVAMYRAKVDRSGASLYSAAHDHHRELRLYEIAELRTALDEDQLVLHYQPKVDLSTGEVCGVEALVRWDHPRRGLLYPDVFLPLVEEAGLMAALTRRVLSEALRQVAQWRAEGRDLSVAVNLSCSGLVDPDLVVKVQRLLDRHGLPGSALQLEITESLLLTDSAGATASLTALRALGVQVSLDDFGTGYSSLSYLRTLPLDEVKLDRSFVFPMADDARAAALVAATVALAHSLGLRLVAEGVENGTTLTELARLGCDQAQGYHLSRPLPAVELELWLDARQSAGTPA